MLLSRHVCPPLLPILIAFGSACPAAPHLMDGAELGRRFRRRAAARVLPVERQQRRWRAGRRLKGRCCSWNAATGARRRPGWEGCQGRLGCGGREREWHRAELTLGTSSLGTRRGRGRSGRRRSRRSDATRLARAGGPRHRQPWRRIRRRRTRPRRARRPRIDAPRARGPAAAERATAAERWAQRGGMGVRTGDGSGDGETGLKVKPGWARGAVSASWLGPGTRAPSEDERVRGGMERGKPALSTPLFRAKGTLSPLLLPEPAEAAAEGAAEAARVGGTGAAAAAAATEVAYHKGGEPPSAPPPPKTTAPAPAARGRIEPSPAQHSRIARVAEVRDETGAAETPPHPEGTGPDPEIAGPEADGDRAGLGTEIA
eukprot:scaffold11049_cov96-Isochrysis_galbana.AAC.5